MRTYYVYLMASRKNGTLFVGIASDLKKQVYKHRNGLVQGFTKKHAITRLVWYAQAGDESDAIARANQIKGWSDGWQRKLIEENNKEWRDLYEEL